MKSIMQNVFRLSAFAAICLGLLACVSTPVSAADYNWRIDGTASAFTDGPSWTPAWTTGSAPWITGDTANFLAGTNTVTGDVFLKGDTKMNGVHLIAQAGSITTATGAMEIRRGDTLFSVLSGAEFTIGGSIYIDGGIILDGGTLTQTAGQFRVCHDGNNFLTGYTGVVELKNGAMLNAFNLQLNHTSGSGNEVKLLIDNSTANISGEFIVGADKGKASVTQTGSVSVVTFSGTNFIIANSTAANGSSYTISGGTLNINGGTFTVGGGGRGEFHQDGGTVNISGAANFRINSSTTSNGSAYYLDGGILNYGLDGGSGSFNMSTTAATRGFFYHTGGTFNFGSDTNPRDMTIQNSTAVGSGNTYDISGDDSYLNLSRNLQLALGGMFSHTDGATVKVANELLLGTAGGNATYYAMDGEDSLLEAQSIRLSRNSNFTQNNGDITIHGNLHVGEVLGTSSGNGSAAYTMKDGSITFDNPAGNFIIGTSNFIASLSSVFTMEGGEILFQGNQFMMGAETTAKTGTAGSTFNLTGGTFTYQGSGDVELGVVADRNVNFNHTGGTFDVQDGKAINLNSGATYTLNGANAELKAATVDTSGGGTFTFTAGTAEIENFIGDLSQPAGTTLSGLLNVTGTYTLATDATLNLLLDSPGDKLTIDGDATLEGLINIILSDDFISSMGYAPVPIIEAMNLVDFNDNYNILTSGDYTLDWSAASGVVTLLQHTTPEPATWVMLLAALGMLGVMRRRR